MLINEETLQIQKLEDEKYKRDLEWQEELVSYYLDCINACVMTCEELFDKTKYFDAYNAELVNQNKKIVGITIPEYLKSIANTNN